MNVTIDEHDRELHVGVMEDGLGVMLYFNGKNGRNYGSVAYVHGRHGIEDIVNFNIPQGWTNRRAIMAVFIQLGKDLESLSNREAALDAPPFDAPQER